MSTEQIIYRLKQARKLRGLSLREAAKGLSISHEALRKFELGKIKMDSEKIIRFAKFYNVRPDYLIPSNHRPEITFGEIHICKLNSKYC